MHFEACAGGICSAYVHSTFACRGEDCILVCRHRLGTPGSIAYAHVCHFADWAQLRGMAAQTLLADSFLKNDRF